MTEETLFAEALEKSPEERSVFLDEACKGNTELRERVEQLLKVHDEPGSFLAQSAEEDFDATLDMSADPANSPVTPTPGLSGDDDLDATLPQFPMTSDATDPAANMSAQAGELSTLGADPDAAVPFIFGQRIAQGGMGAILEANDSKLGRIIAAKVMLSDGAPHKDDQKRFVQEAAVLGKLEHPNIVPVYDLGRDSESQLYYTMKMVHGRTLQDIIDDLQKKDPKTLAHYTLDRLLTIFRKICDAMAFAHSRKIIHRDLKPENIMVGEFGEVLVMDWGLSKVLDGSAEIPVEASGVDHASGAESLTATLQGSVMGTPKYMSPEQAMGLINELDERSDIFSLGGILYAILTLRPPVEGTTLEEVLEKVAGARITSPSAFGTTNAGSPEQAKGSVLEAKKIKPLPHIREGKAPSALSAVAMKALRLKKEKRYQEVAELNADIEKYQSGFATTAEKAGLGTQLKLLIKRNKGIFTTAAAAWLIVTGLAVWFVLNLQTKEKRARRAEAVAVQREGETRKALARASVSLADASLREGNGAAMQSALTEVPEDLRNPTWHYLQEASDTSIASVETGASITGVAAHPRLRHVFAVGDDGGKVTFFNVRTGERLLEFSPKFTKEPSARNFLLAISPDGERIAVGRSGKPGLLILNARDGRKLVEWDLPGTFRLEFDKNGKRLLQTTTYNGKLGLNMVDWKNGRLAWSYEASKNTPLGTHGSFTPNGDQVLTYGFGDGLRLVNAEDGSLVRPLTIHPGVIKHLAMGAEGLAAVADRAGFVTLFDPQEDRLVSRFQASLKAVDWLAFAPDGEQILTATMLRDGRQEIQLWHPESDHSVQSFLGGTGYIHTLSIHPLSEEFLISGENPRAWNLQGTEAKWTLSQKSSGTSIAFWGTDDQLFAPGGGGNGLALHQLGETSVTALWKESSFKPKVSVSRDRQSAVIGIQGKAPVIRDTGPETNGTIKMHLPFNPESVRMSPAGECVAAVHGGRDSVHLFESSTGTRRVTLERRKIKVFRDIGWLKDGQQLVGLVTATEDRGNSASEEWIVLWDATNGKILKTQPNVEAMDVLAIAPDDRRFAEAGAGNTVRIRDAETLEVLQEFRAHDDAITALAWHPHRPVLATASRDFRVRLWDLETGSRLDEVRGLMKIQYDLAFSPSGQLLAGAGSGDTPRIWEPLSLKAVSKNETGDDDAIDENRWFADPLSYRSPDTEAWSDLLSPLTPEFVKSEGNGWKMKDGVLQSPDRRNAVMPFSGNLAGVSYQLRVKLRQHQPEESFNIILPVGKHQVEFVLDGWPQRGHYTGLSLVDGKEANGHPNAVSGKQVRDSDLHDLEVTVRVDEREASITTKLDGEPLHDWVGPVSSLSLRSHWDATPLGPLGPLMLVSHAADWEVSGVKVIRLKEPDPVGGGEELFELPRDKQADKKEVEALLSDGKWEEAVKILNYLFETEPGDSFNEIRLGSSLLLSGDQSGYEQFRSDLIKGIDLSDAWQLERGLKGCLLSPASEKFIKALPIDAAKTFLNDTDTGKSTKEWLKLSLALASLRSGKIEDTQALCSEIQRSKSAPLQANALAVLSISQATRGEIKAAQSSLDQIAPLHDSTKGALVNWLTVEVLRREAETLLAELKKK